MEKTFRFTKTLNGICLNRYIGTQEEVMIPGQIDNIPVTSIAAYAFHECRKIKKIFIPDSVTELGNHAFYNCRALTEVSFSDGICSIGDGSFKNCGSLAHLNLRVKENCFTGLKGILDELNQELIITLIYTEGKESCLIFPRYLHDYEENTQARIINQVTYGSGVHYRECVGREKIDYRQYDELIAYTIANDQIKTALSIARVRLTYPYELLQTAKARYKTLIKNNLSDLIEGCLKEDDMDGILFLGSQDMYTGDNIDQWIKMANTCSNVEGTAFFINYKHKYLGAREKTFEL